MKSNRIISSLLVLLTTMALWACRPSQSASMVGHARDPHMAEYLIMDSANALIPRALITIGKDTFRTGFDGRLVYRPIANREATISAEGYQPARFSLSPSHAGHVLMVRIKAKPVSLSNRYPHYPTPARRYETRSAKDDMILYAVTDECARVELESAAVSGDVIMSSKASGGVANMPSAGSLTAGEVNDFAKWSIWPVVMDGTHRQFISHWRLTPRQRYMLQVVGRDAYPVANLSVSLIDRQGNTIYQARTDNTGRAELWNGLTSAPVAGPLRLMAAGQTIPAVPFAAGDNLISLDEPCAPSSEADVFFIVDATGSMGDELHYLQAEMADVISRSQGAVDGLTIRTGALVYRDHADEYLTRISRLTSDISVTQSFLAHQQANGGGDFPEAIPEALMATLGAAGWDDNARARVAFLILDAPCHTDSATIALLHDQVLQAAAMGVRLVPVVCSGLDEAGELLMRSLALATNGTSFFLTDDSGIGHTHLRPTTDTLPVEHLNDMLVRTIIEFTRMPDCDPQLWLEQSADDDPIEAFLPNPTDDLSSPTDPAPLAAEVMTVAPVPCHDFCEVRFLQDVEALYLVDVSGKTIMALGRHTAGETLSVPMTSLSAGVYFFKAYAAHHWVTAKILKIGNF